jgi:hypothetical protein
VVQAEQDGVEQGCPAAEARQARRQQPRKDSPSMIGRRYHQVGSQAKACWATSVSAGSRMALPSTAAASNLSTSRIQDCPGIGSR